MNTYPNRIVRGPYETLAKNVANEQAAIEALKFRLSF